MEGVTPEKNLVSAAREEGNQKLALVATVRFLLQRPCPLPEVALSQSLQVNTISSFTSTCHLLQKALPAFTG